MSESLKELTGRWRSALASGDCGPLVIAADVVRVGAEWDEKYKEEAGGASCTTWLRRELGPGRNLAWFARRHEAVEHLGESIRRTMHHEVAVWIHDNVPKEAWTKVVMAVTIAAKKQRGVPLTPPQARRVVCPIIGKVSGTKRGCSRCSDFEVQVALLEQEIERLRQLLERTGGKNAAE